MRRRSLVLSRAAAAILGVALLGSALTACDRAAPSPSPDPNVRTLALPSLEPTLPEGPGRSQVVGSCRTCHSPAYLLNQPRFSRKTWSAEIEKMKNVYGAPIPPDAVAPILEYLVALRGDGT